MIKKIDLKEVADISAGYSFRGKIPSIPDGGVSVIQMKDVSEEEGVNPKSVIETTLSSKNEPDWLCPGDILLVARGSNRYAVLYNGDFQKAVASPHFFVIRVKSQNVMPEFIVWQLNQISVQRYFEKEAEGSVAKSIKRASLVQAPITLPEIKQQKIILSVYKNLREQKRIHRELIENSDKFLKYIALNLEQNIIR